MRSSRILALLLLIAPAGTACKGPRKHAILGPDAGLIGPDVGSRSDVPRGEVAGADPTESSGGKGAGNDGSAGTDTDRVSTADDAPASGLDGDTVMDASHDTSRVDLGGSTGPACGPQDGRCPSGCASAADPDCRKSNGLSCTADLECNSGHCRAGFCCNTTCGDPCFSCAASATGSANGICAAVRAGLDPASHCTKAEEGTCGNDGECDGSGSCSKYDPGTVCAQATCSGATAVPARRCSGNGTCLPAAGTVCGEYVCDQGVCKTRCISDVDCTVANYCEETRCVPRCAAQSSENLVPNAGFDRAIWTYETALSAWDPSDSTACETSGSARVDPQGAILSDCFVVDPAKSYFFGIMIRGENLNSTQQGCSVGWFNDTCTETVAPATFGAPVQPLPGWQRLRASINPPTGATRGRVACLNFSNSSSFHIDRAFFNATAPAF